MLAAMLSAPRPALLALLLFGLCGLPSAAVCADATAEEGAILARIKPPQFAHRDFPITDFGAAAEADCTVALARAIAACQAAGGGRVAVPAGVWLTGAVHLKSNVNLHLAEGATLRF